MLRKYYLRNFSAASRGTVFKTDSNHSEALGYVTFPLLVICNSFFKCKILICIVETIEQNLGRQ